MSVNAGSLDSISGYRNAGRKMRILTMMIMPQVKKIKCFNIKSIRKKKVRGKPTMITMIRDKEGRESDI